MLLSTISLIYYFILFKCCKSLHTTPESMLSEVKERLEGLKYNIDFGERGWGNTGEEDRYMHIHYGKRGHFTEVPKHFCPLYCSSPSLKGRRKTHKGKNVRTNNAYCVSYKNLYASTSVKSNCAQNKNRALTKADADSRVLRNSLTSFYCHFLFKRVQKES